MRAKKIIISMAGLLFVGVFCLSSGAFGSVPSGQTRSVSEVVFIDPSVQEAETIVAQLPRGAEVVRLSPGTDAVALISAHLAKKRDLSAIRIISHGNDGYIVLNGNIIDSEYLAENSGQISSWSNSLSENADIMLYGCNVAESGEGREFVDNFADLTGADIAAATFATGGVEANWQLDYHTGAIETVSLTVDGYDYHLDDQVVTINSDSGGNSLRLAIADVHAGGEITFNISGSDTVTIAAELSITKSMTIDGYNNATGNNVTVEVTDPGTSTWRVFNINASGETVTISNMIINGGDISGEGNVAAGYGGGIYIAAGTLNFEALTVTGSKAYKGGGIYGASGSTVNIDNSTISDNTTGDGGSGNPGGAAGGIYSSGGAFTVTNSTISANTTGDGGSGDPGGDGGDGGGIYSSGGTFTVNNSTIFANVTGNGGTGGMPSGAGGDGCGIYSSGGTFTVNNSTISANETGSGGGGAGGNTPGYGGGIYLDGATLTVENTIIANNTRGGATTSDDYFYASGTLTNNGYNVIKKQHENPGVTNYFGATDSNDIIYDSSSSLWKKYGASTTELTDKNLNLSENLADNGTTNGTYTLALETGSFAIGAIGYSVGGDTWNNSSGITGGNFYDQRGIETPANNPISIGAYSDYTAPVTIYYMAKDSGNWSAFGTVWFTNTTGGTVAGNYTTQATEAPTAANSDGIIINDNITVTVTAAASLDETTVNTGASLVINSGQTLTLANGDGTDLTVAGTGAVDVVGTLEADGSQINYTGTGALNLTAETSILNFNSGATVAGTSTFTNDGTVTSTTTTAISITAATIHAGTITSTGGAVNLTGSTAVNLAAGKSITTTIEANDGTASGAIDINVSDDGTVTLDGNLVTTGAARSDGTASTGGAVNIDTNNGTITFNDITTTGGAGTNGNTGGASGALNLTSTGGQAITLNGTLSLIGGTSDSGTGGAGGAFSVSKAFLGEAVRIDASGGVGGAANGGAGGITFSGILDGTQTLTLDAAGSTNGDINFDGIVGGTALGAVTIEDAKDVNVDKALTAASFVQSAGSGTTILYDNVTTSAIAGVNITNDNGIVLDGLNIVTTNSGVVTFNDEVNLKTADVDIDAAGTITFAELNTVYHLNLTLESDANINFNEIVGATNEELGAIQINNAVNVTAENFIRAASFVQNGGTLTTLKGDVETTVAAGVDITATNIVLDELTVTTTDITTDSGVARFNGATNLTTGKTSINANGAITFTGALTSTGDRDLGLVSAANIDFNAAVGSGDNKELGAITVSTVNITAESTIEAASFNQTKGTGGTTTLKDNVTTTAATGVTIKATNIVLDELTITTTNSGIVRFRGATNLTTGNTSINANGTITFTEGYLTSTGDRNLTLESAADIVFVREVGKGDDKELGAIQINNAVNVTAGRTIEAASFVQSDGTLTTLKGDVDTTAIAGVDITATNIVLDGLTVTTTNSGVARFNGATDLTAAAANINANGAIEFTNTIDGGQALSLQSGSADITVGGIIGGTTAVSSLDFDGANISLNSIGDSDTVGVSGAKDINASTDITFNGATYKTNAATYTAGTDFNVDAGSATTFTTSNDAITFAKTGDTGGNIKLSDGSDLVINAGTGAVTALKIDGTSFENVSITGGTVSIGAVGTQTANGIANLTINNTTDSTLGGNIEINGTLIKNGSAILNPASVNITAGGLTVSDGTFGSAASTGTWDINGDVSIASGKTLVATSGNMSVSGNWINANPGTLTHNSGTVTFDGSGTSTITGSTTFYNFTCTTAGKTLTFNTAGTQTITNFTLTRDSGNNIIVNSNNTGTQAEIVVTNSAVSYVTVTDSNNSGTVITPTNSINSGNNEGWLFNSIISGIVYTDAGSTVDGTSRNISISVNGSTTLYSGTSTAGTGAYSITTTVLSNNDVVTIYINGEAVYGSTVIISDATDNITNAHVFENYLRLDAEGATNVTNANLAVADNVDDADIKFTVDGSNALSVTQSSGIYAIKYAPGANITASPGITVPSGSTVAVGSNTFTINGAATIDGTLSISTGTVTTSGLSDINDILSITSTGIYDANGAFDATGGNVTFTGAGNLFLGSTVASLGTFTKSTSTVTYDGADQTILALDYATLALSSTTSDATKTFADGTISVGNEIEIAAADVNTSLTLTGSSASAVTVQVTTPGAAGTVSRVFNVDASGKTVNISNMTINGGDISSKNDVEAGYGGGILCKAGTTLNIENTTISGSKAYRSGGICNYGNVTFTDCTISDSIATQWGGEFVVKREVQPQF